MIKVKGPSLLPKDLERAVMQQEGLTKNQAVLTKDPSRDRLTLKVEVGEPSQDLAERIASAVKGACNVTPEVVFVPPRSLAKGGKTRRIPDTRWMGGRISWVAKAVDCEGIAPGNMPGPKCSRAKVRVQQADRERGERGGIIYLCLRWPKLSTGEEGNWGR